MLIICVDSQSVTWTSDEEYALECNLFPFVKVGHRSLVGFIDLTCSALDSNYVPES